MGLDRNFYLRLMIGALICAAVFGVLAVVTGSWNVVGKVIWSAFVVGVGSALMMPVSGWLDNRKNTAAGLVGMSVIIAQVICFIGAAWWGNWDGWRLAVIGLALFPTGWPLAFLLLGQTGEPLAISRKIGAVVFPVVLLLVVVALCIDLMIPSSTTYGTYPNYTSPVDQKLYFTGVSLWFMGVLSMMAIAGWSAIDRQYWRWLGVAASSLAFLILAYAIWADIHEGSGVLDVIISIAVFIAYANQILLLNLRPGHRYLRLGTITLTGATIAICCMYAISMKGQSWDSDFFMGRIAVAGVILSACMTLSLLILARISRGVNVDLNSADDTALDINQLDLTCPRCQLRQKLGLGESHCSQCKLRFTIQVEEPRCTKCGFLLYKCTSENCPECGTPTATVAAVQG